LPALLSGALVVGPALPALPIRRGLAVAARSRALAPNRQRRLFGTGFLVRRFLLTAGWPFSTLASSVLTRLASWGGRFGLNNARGLVHLRLSFGRLHCLFGNDIREFCDFDFG
jgi:hypothetical protein